MEEQTPLTWFYQWEKARPDAIFLRQPFNRNWKTWTFRQAGEEIRYLAGILSRLPPRSKVAILSKNCAHWIMADLAIMMAGHISVPLYATLGSDSIKSILAHSESSAIIIGKLDNYAGQQSGIPDSLMRISIAAYGIIEGITWETCVQSGRKIEQPATQHPDEVMTIIYTSGTTGRPKGVMHTAGNFSSVIAVVDKVLPQLPDGLRMFSYLPLSHIAERLGIEMLGLYKGAFISFAESVETFADDLKKTQPEVFFAVPRIWSKIQEKILNRIPRNRLDRLLSTPVIGTLLKKRLKKELGLSKALYICSGAAPLSVDLIRWFEKLGIVIHQNYGMTEDCVYSHFNLIGSNKPGTVGRPLPGAETKISKEGELRIRTRSLMKGYYKEPELTEAAFDEEGYLCTGDLAEYDEEGYLRITGRLKDQFKTDKGKYITPAPIELMLTCNPDVEQVCVVGTGIPQPIALIVLSESGMMKSLDAITESLTDLLQKVNSKLEIYEQLAKMVILREEWSIQNGLLTPTLKVKRTEIEKIYLPLYPHWYRQEGQVIWA